MAIDSRICIGIRVRGLGGCNPLTRAKALFFGQSQQPKMEKYIYIILYLLNEKT